MCSSGDQTAKAAEATTADFQKQLMNVFTQQYGQQSSILDYLKNTLEPGITNPQGYGDQALAAMRTGATDTISNQYQNAQKALQARQFSTGGENLPSGVNEMQSGALAQGQASDTATAQNNITTADAQLKNQNYWNSINALNGVAAAYNPNGTASNANGAGSTVAGLSNAVSTSQAVGMSPINSLLGAAGGVGSALIGKKW
jgi:hypothetical protein